MPVRGIEAADGALRCEGVALERIAQEAGTPAYVYSAAVLRDRVARLDAALAGAPHAIHYSCKANGSRGVLEVLRAAGSCVDVVSGGELFKALRAGFRPDQILFGGVGKQAHELREALRVGVKLINVESLAELHLVSRLAGELGVVANVGLRVNPEVEVLNAHRYIATGEKGHKFGIPIDEAEAVGRVALRLPHVALRALDMHVGSQLESFTAYEAGTARLVELSLALRRSGAELRYLDAGGGLPVPYDGSDEPDLETYGRIVTAAANTLGVELLVEPGRFFVAAAGTLLTKVLYVKDTGAKTYVICDAGMTELLRPSHYDAYHRIEPVRARPGAIVADIVGPVCESGDFLALDRELPEVEPGDLLAVHTAGAYGYVMSSTYNARPRAAEVMVDGARWAVVTARETYEDLVRLEAPVPHWREA
ncbi:MAG: diaminopimelate decarboxylase [Gemmatimonadaceae bacterium]|nr:diaminopimelate decarboxylase [Gemmatimonadaceae bacterium]